MGKIIATFLKIDNEMKDSPSLLQKPELSSSNQVEMVNEHCWCSQSNLSFFFQPVLLILYCVG